MNVAPLFFFIIHCWLLRYGKANSVVKDVLRSALPLARARKSSLHDSHRSTQTSASVGADIRIGRRRHSHRSAQPSASVDADIRIGRRRCINRRVWHPCHTHAATPQPSAATPRSHMYAADCVGIAGMLYPPTDCVGIARMLYPPIDSVGLTALPDIRA